jgi:ABC-type amino acid transport substrate-binding protein
MRTYRHSLRHWVWVLFAVPLCNAATILREPGVLSIAVYTDFAPFSQSAEGDYQGIDVALARRLAERLNLKLRLLPFNAGENMTDDLRNMVWRGDILHYGPADVMLHVPVDRRFSGANDQALIFAPYYRETLVLLRDIRALPVVSSASDLIGKWVATEQGTAAASALLGAEGGALREKIRMSSTPEGALRLLTGGDVAAALVTRAQAEAALRFLPDHSMYAMSELSLNGLPSGGWAVGMAVKADNSELAARLAQAIEDLARSGELHDLFAAQGLTLVRP